MPEMAGNRRCGGRDADGCLLGRLGLVSSGRGTMRRAASAPPAATHNRTALYGLDETSGLRRFWCVHFPRLFSYSERTQIVNGGSYGWAAREARG